MAEVYRITGIQRVWTGNQIEEVRRTISRAGGTLAYYEDYPAAKRAVPGIRRWGGGKDLQIETIDWQNHEWVPVSASAVPGATV